MTDKTLQEDMFEVMKELGGEDVLPATAVEESSAPAAQTGEAAAPVAAAPAQAAPTTVGAAAPDGQGAPSDQQGGWTQDKAPQSWTPAAREKWTAIPEDIRKEIVRREEAAVNGVRQLQEKYAPHEHFTNTLAPFIQEGIQAGVAPDVYISNVLQAERVLRTADVPAKFQALLGIADQYGIPLRDIINESVGQKVLGPASAQQRPTVPPEVAAEIQEMRRWRAQQEGAGIQQTVEQFRQGKEFFEDVRVAMADLIDTGRARTLEEAYDQACWMTPEVRTVMLQRQQGQTQISQRQQRAAGVSIPAGGKVNVADEDFGNEDDVSDTIRKAFALTSGRV